MYMRMLIFQIIKSLFLQTKPCMKKITLRLFFIFLAFFHKRIIFMIKLLSSLYYLNYKTFYIFILNIYVKGARMYTPQNIFNQFLLVQTRNKCLLQREYSRVKGSWRSGSNASLASLFGDVPGSRPPQDKAAVF